MKTTIAFHALIAAVCNAGHATAQQTSNVRGSVEEREEERREVWYDPKVEDATAVNSELLNAPITEGAGYDKVNGSIQIPACVGLTPAQCLTYAQNILAEKPGWFGNPSAGLTDYVVELADNVGYYYVGIPVDSKGGFVAGNGMVHYPYDWCVEVEDPDDNTKTIAKCTSLQPWDCSGRTAIDCCENVILEDYPGMDLNGNKLQCYEHLNGGNGNPCLMDGVVTMHTVNDGGADVVAIPASIPKAPLNGATCEYVATAIDR